MEKLNKINKKMYRRFIYCLCKKLDLNMSNINKKIKCFSIDNYISSKDCIEMCRINSDIAKIHHVLDIDFEEEDEEALDELIKQKNIKIGKYYTNKIIKCCNDFLKKFISIFSKEEIDYLNLKCGSNVKHKIYANTKDMFYDLRKPQIEEMNRLELAISNTINSNKEQIINIVKDTLLIEMLNALIYFYGTKSSFLTYKKFLTIIGDEDLCTKIFYIYKFYICNMMNANIKCNNKNQHYNSLLYNSSIINEDSIDINKINLYSSIYAKSFVVNELEIQYCVTYEEVINLSY